MTHARKPRRKQYRPRAVRAPMLVATDLVLRPLEAIIDQINRDGTVHTDAKGIPQFRAGDGKWYESAGAIEGVIWLRTDERRVGIE
ncbi:hypothetical protein G6F22_021897 [Rhizopus arrhizus]|nr:hypothetical protein G6F22_021897 [Rhizopus arrhizus]